MPHTEASPLAGRCIVLGVSGSIAAYKAVELCRRLVDAGATVVPILTEAATRFVGTPTFSALASEPARTALFEDPVDPIPHVTLARRADIVVVAPATARVIASYAGGSADDLLTSTLLATRAPVIVCPAMHDEMWGHPAVQENVATLRRRGVILVEPESGRLAGGDEGQGRLASVDAVVQAIGRALGPEDLGGRSVLVTAGGTREPIDPVRFIGNRSSGKQGHAVAAEAARRGAKVTLVTSSSVEVPEGVEVINVSTAAEMESAVTGRAQEFDVVVLAAAVADFRPVGVAAQKLRKADGVPDIKLEATTDIAAAVSERRRPGQVLVGFAAETEEVVENATRKLLAKGLDIIVANNVVAPGAGFEHDTNEVTIVTGDGTSIGVPMTTKQAVAVAAIDAVVERLAKNAT